MRGNSGCSFDRRKVTDVNGCAIGPMRDLTLSDPDGLSEFLLASGDLDGSFNSGHAAHISNAYADSQQQCCLRMGQLRISVANMSDDTKSKQLKKRRKLNDIEKAPGFFPMN